MVFLQEVALDDNHNRIGDVLRVRRKEKRYIESVNPSVRPVWNHSLVVVVIWFYFRKILHKNQFVGCKIILTDVWECNTWPAVVLYGRTAAICRIDEPSSLWVWFFWIGSKRYKMICIQYRTHLLSQIWFIKTDIWHFWIQPFQFKPWIQVQVFWANIIRENLEEKRWDTKHLSVSKCFGITSLD